MTLRYEIREAYSRTCVLSGVGLPETAPTSARNSGRAEL